MATVDGTDDGDKGYGVLGRGVPWEYQDRDGVNVSVNSVGIWGLLGTAADIASIEDQVSGTFGQTVAAAIAGRNTLPSGGHAVYGEHRSYLSVTTTFGSLAGSDRSGQPVGVYGESDHQGVVGVGSGTGTGVVGVASGAGTGVYGKGSTGGSFDGTFEGVHAVSHDPRAAGVAGYNDKTGPGIFGKSTGGGAAGYFDGDVVVTGVIQMTRADYAEEFTVADPDGVEPGMVMVLDEVGGVRVSREAYDRRVAGVVSGACGYKPAVILDHDGALANRLPLALMGKVYCMVDATDASVRIGDLLTTSSVPGHAMKAADPLRAFGSVIGKALRPLAGGRGLVPILVRLQ